MKPLGKYPLFTAASLALFSLAQCSSAGNAQTCKPAEPDGIAGGSATFDLSVNDSGFMPTILKAENLATVTLMLTNTGTKPHGFTVHCIPVPGANGCPATSCFPDASTIAPIGPGASATTTFVAPNPEGIYDFSSSAPSDTMTGQFVVQ